MQDIGRTHESKKERAPQKQGCCRMVQHWWWTRERVCILWMMVYTGYGWWWRSLWLVKIKRHCEHNDMPLKMHNTVLLFMFHRPPSSSSQGLRKNSDGEIKRVKWCGKIGVLGLLRSFVRVDCDSDPTLQNLHHSIPSTPLFLMCPFFFSFMIFSNFLHSVFLPVFFI